MLELVAEDAGIEDTLYYLDKALHGDTLDLQTHLKVCEILVFDVLCCFPYSFVHVCGLAQLTRNLCREQFQKRALALRVLDLQKQRA